MASFKISAKYWNSLKQWEKDFISFAAPHKGVVWAKSMVAMYLRFQAKHPNAELIGTKVFLDGVMYEKWEGVKELQKTRLTIADYPNRRKFH